ncbi:MAG: hypothetical protein ABWZ30_04475, partial [Jiangellaceae bacterium]
GAPVDACPAIGALLAPPLVSSVDQHVMWTRSGIAKGMTEGRATSWLQTRCAFASCVFDLLPSSEHPPPERTRVMLRAVAL